MSGLPTPATVPAGILYSSGLPLNQLYCKYCLEVMSTKTSATSYIRWYPKGVDISNPLGFHISSKLWPSWTTGYLVPKPDNLQQCPFFVGQETKAMVFDRGLDLENRQMVPKGSYFQPSIFSGANWLLVSGRVI